MGKKKKTFLAHFFGTLNFLFAVLFILSAFSGYLDPTAFKYISWIGILFPFLLIILLIFFILWIIVPHRYALISLISIAICYYPLTTYVPFNFRQEEVPEKSFKVLSYNVMRFNNLNKKNGKNKILEYLAKSDADLICLQEYVASKHGKKLNRRDIYKALKKYKYKSVPNNSHGVACFSKFPILSSKRIKYESRFNGSMIYRIKIKKDTFLVVNNHLESNKLNREDKIAYEKLIGNEVEMKAAKDEAKYLLKKYILANSRRAEQIKIIKKELKAADEKYIIFCGDFNDSPISYPHMQVSKTLKDAHTESGLGWGISYNKNKFWFRLDNIFISKNLKSYNCTVDNSIKSSDHYPIWCYISKK